VRPLLKWAGGKRQLLPRLRRHYPARFDRYLEPFLGSGAVFFDLFSSGLLEGRRVLLADANPDLIGCYRAVRDDPDGVIAALSALEKEHRRRGSACYYEVRDERFNPSRPAEGAYTPALAAMFIYLNRTGYNGLFRLTRRGGFNVPAGRYADPRICDAAHVRAVGRALASRGVSLDCVMFDEVMSDTYAGDFVYCDPPYVPMSRTANFANYTAGGFGPADQQRLQKALVGAAARGVFVLASNSGAITAEAAYTLPAARLAGLAVERVPARRAINSRAALRGPIDELVITNVAIGGQLRQRPRPAMLHAATADRLPLRRTHTAARSRPR